MHASDLQKIIDLMEKHELGRPVVLGSFGNGPSSSGVGVAGGSGSCPSSASSGVVDAEAPPAKRAKTEPGAGVACTGKPFDQRPSRFRADDIIEVPLPNGLVMLFATQSHVMLYNPRATDLKLEGGTVLCGFQKGNWYKEATYTAESPVDPAKDILYELKDACSITVASGSRWAAQTTTIGLQVLSAWKTDAATKVMYHNMVQKPTTADPNNFELEIAHKMYWQVQATAVPKGEPTQPTVQPRKIGHDNAGGLLPVAAWEGSTAWHTKLAFVVRYNKQRHGLLPVRPHVVLCNEITLKPSMYTMLIGGDESAGSGM